MATRYNGWHSVNDAVQICFRDGQPTRVRLLPGYDESALESIEPWAAHRYGLRLTLAEWVENAGEKTAQIKFTQRIGPKRLKKNM